jgi:hypothetical protein
MRRGSSRYEVMGSEAGEAMERKKIIVLSVALLLAVGMGVYPPWVVSFSYPSGSVGYSAGYGFIFSPPFSGL